jgi:hypothetical protein
MLAARTAPTEVSRARAALEPPGDTDNRNCRCYGRERFMAMPEWVKSELRANFARITRDGALRIELTNGVSLTVPVKLIPSLKRAAPGDVRSVQVLGRGCGLHWESLDLDLSVMKLTHHLTAACLLLVGSGAAAPRGDSEFIRITPDDVHWVDVPGGHGAQMATLQGNPDKLGPYVIRAKFPPT